MKCIIPEISWHNRDPVLSVDIQVKKEGDSIYRMASGGTDSHVLIWHINLKEGGALTLDCVADLTRHQKAVNVVRFSPNGEFLASGDDESTIIIWKQKTEQDLPEMPTNNESEEENKEQWVQAKILRGHLNDVYDISWSPNSTHLVSASVDNTAIVWDFQKGKKLAILDDHKNFVQGVAWDPKNQYLATLCSDGKCRVFCSRTFKVVARVGRGKLPGADPEAKPVRLFHDDTLKSFFRRLSFSPDGLLLAAPAGQIEPPQDSTDKPSNATFVFVRKHFSNPVMYYPSGSQSSMVVRWCPLKFTLRPNRNPVVNLPYRMVAAIATKSTILLYDTQHAVPIGMVSNIHYTKLTDLSWSSDGRILVASSTDGYCSVVTFLHGELGDIYVQETVSSQQTQF